MKFHVTFGYKKKVIEVVYPHVIRSVITRSFNLPISNFNIQKWYDEWHDWVDVEPPELTDGDRLNLVMNPPELVMGLSPGASGVIGHSPATHCTSPMVNTPIVTSNNFISNNSVVTNSSIMANSTMVRAYFFFYFFINFGEYLSVSITVSNDNIFNKKCETFSRLNTY